jgi:CRP-like cAMP-binding protein
VTYLIKELRPGDFFGLEELITIAYMKLEGETKKNRGKIVTRQLKVTAINNSKLLYLTAQSFYSMFGELELKKLKEFTETYDMAEI